MTSLAGKRCLVTGGSRNLGRALCVAFAKAGARVAFTWRERANEAAETQRLCGGALAFQGDVQDGAHAQATVDALVKAWGGVDVLVNNAAIAQVLPFALIEEADFDRMMAVNVKGPFLFARAALRPMLRQKSGAILNVGTFATGRVVGGKAHFLASKAALAGLSESLAAEVGRYGVRVHLLAPGLLEGGQAQRLPPHRRDEFTQNAALGRVGTFEEIAAYATWLVSDENALMTGGRVVVDGGL